jgi:alpha-tubulin suppressor-like RCC1 family protein
VNATKNVQCWGAGNFRQLGYGEANSYNTIYVRKHGQTSTLLSNATTVSSGAHHSCAVMTSGNVACWGLRNQGRLGDGGGTQPNGYVFVQSPGGSGTFSSISAGKDHTCGVESGGAQKVWCWGTNDNGQLGNGKIDSFGTPSQVGGIDSVDPAVNISAGGNFTCATLASGQLKCWGLNGNGQLGNNTYQATNSSTPGYTLASTGVNLSAVANVTAGGDGGTCALMGNGSLKCWGSGNNGRIGDNGNTANKPLPVNVNKSGPQAGFPATISVTVTPGSAGQSAGQSATQAQVNLTAG